MTDCIKKWYQQKIIFLDMNVAQKVYVFGTKSKQNNFSFCCCLNHIICFCKSRVMPHFVRRGKIPFVPLFVFIEEIVIKDLNNETVWLLKMLIICEDNDEKKIPKHIV